jgi:SAM-dependent methyltransferase
MSVVENPWLYQELAGWWHLFSPPSHYVEEAQDLLPELLAASDAPPRTLLELGAGAGSLAHHLKGKLHLTLTDRSPQMLEVSQRVNPECAHLLGDMRTLDLGRTFDLVLVHDAIMYTTDSGSLKQVFATAYRHLRPGGGAVFVPDCVQETFEPATTTGGEDGADGRALRYLQWTWDPDPSDQSYEVAWAFLLREADGSVRVETDHHQFGLFPRAAWLALMREVGFVARSRLDPWGRDVFVARKPSRPERGA